MKTAISVPDDLFEAAERFAGREGISRSELYATALRRYLQEHSGERITERLDEIYGTEPSELDQVIVSLQVNTLPRDEC